MESPEVRTPGDSMNSKERIGVKLEFINLPIYKKSTLTNRQIRHELKITKKIYYILDLSQRILWQFSFLSYTQRYTSKLSFYCGWNLHSIN